MFFKIRDICGKRITECDNADPLDPVNKAKLRREKAAIAQYFNDVEYNDDEEAPRAPANENETANKTFLRVKTQLNYLRVRYQNENVPEAAKMRTVYLLVLAKCFDLLPR